MKNRNVLLTVVSLALIILLSACGAISSVNDAGEAFMSSLSTGDTAASWDMLSSDLQAEIGDQAAWTDTVSGLNYTDWSFSNTQIENNQAQLDGETKFDGDTYTLMLVFDKVNDAWLVSGFNIALKE